MTGNARDSGLAAGTTPLIESVKILRLRPGDVLVIEAQGLRDSQEMEELRERAQEEFPGHKIVVTNGVTLRVTREEDDGLTPIAIEDGHPVA